MLGLAVITVVSLPLLYSSQRKDNYHDDVQYDYYTKSSNFDLSYESKIVDLESSCIPETTFEEKSFRHSLLKSIPSFIDFKELSMEVSKNLYSILNELPEEIVNMIDVDEIYTSDIGTIIMDIRMENALFSIEIGKSKIGYFAEVNDIFIYQNDGIEFNSLAITNLGGLFKDLLDLYDKQIVNAHTV
ncbi:hypothetical protein [Sphingobacterium corticibacter]|uniref:Uncharacterized protein n=1 Tax=Sphingobacterium corticibacter TaxID=2171749 RepID=A0A2T8HKE8_9SPHI|nr:hypothetical protein [Sphingobacterium corticibacter]PVH25782.1 hypothetical protein DC487_07565 [Sphingobacterium corticibacter]